MDCHVKYLVLIFSCFVLSGSEESISGSDEESSEYDDEDDDEEPKLKYQRLGAGVTEILKSDSASCLTAHEKFLVCAREVRSCGTKVINNLLKTPKLTKQWHARTKKHKLYKRERAPCGQVKLLLRNRINRTALRSVQCTFYLSA